MNEGDGCIDDARIVRELIVVVKRAPGVVGLQLAEDVGGRRHVEVGAELARGNPALKQTRDELTMGHNSVATGCPRP